MNEYQVLSERHDIPKTLYRKFNAPNDRTAIVRFRKTARARDLAWDDVELVHIGARGAERTIAQFWRPEGQTRRRFDILPKARLR